GQRRPDPAVRPVALQELEPARSEGHGGRRGRRQAVLGPLGQRLLEHPLPQGQDRPGRRDRLGAVLEPQVQGAHRDVGRRLDARWMKPSQGELAWYCGYIMGKDSKNYYHNHEYVDSFIGHDACVDLANTFVYASANLTVKASDLDVAKPGDRKSAYAQPEAI